MKPRPYYLNQARQLLKDAREKKEITYTQLAERLRDHGLSIETRVLINKINRGTFSFQFALQCLAAMDVTSIPISNFVDYKFKAEKGIGPSKKINDPTFDMPELTDDDDMHR